MYAINVNAAPSQKLDEDEVAFLNEKADEERLRDQKLRDQELEDRMRFRLCLPVPDAHILIERLIIEFSCSAFDVQQVCHWVGDGNERRECRR